jgi:hypothetical protein
MDFEHWAKCDHDALLAYLHGSHAEHGGNAGLTFACEAAQGVADERIVAAVVELLGHAAPLVREGALLGLQDSTDAGIRARVGAMATCDPSPGVRATAADLVEDWTSSPSA